MGKHKIKLLCTGDIHLGRYPTKIPEENNLRNYSPAFIWKNIVQKAVELEVDGLLITGDVVDRENCFYEAFGPFEAGIKRLEEAQIPVFVVAGNHDCDLLPGLARNMASDFFHFLGEGGRWEHQTLKIDNQEVMNIIGWSYPARQVRKNPLQGLKLPDNGLPTVGLLHTELDNPASNYAPVSLNELEESRITAWLLGHIHKPELILEAPILILNPGSPQPLNPGETGSHGIWQLVVNLETGIRVSKIPLATLEYMEITADISSLERVEELITLLSNQVRDQLEASREERGNTELVLARVNLEGYTGLHRELEQERARLVQDLELEVAGSRVRFEKIVNQTRPRVELESLLGGNSPAALLAGYLKKIEEGKGEELPDRLLKAVADKLTEAYNSNAYQPLRQANRINPPDRGEILDILKKQARLLLDTLVAGKEELN